ncbi:MAG: fibronectin type III domain-containing protein, partial [Firmicutes bacterium]|nr:fibronectin type III domain-containing protein [Bacillota bacterium]
LEWPEAEDALYYEIYAREGTRGEFSFIASTTRTVYYIIDLDSDTRYYFRVKAINEFGSSEFTSQRSIRTDDTREKDTDGDINGEEKILVDGDTVTVNMPDDALKREHYYSIDLSGPDYSGAVQRTVNVPLGVIRDAHGTFTLNTGDVMLQFSPSALNAAPLWSVSRTDRDISYGRLTVGSAGSDGERAKKYLPAKQRVVSGLHYIGLSAVKGKTEEHCNTFNGSLNMRVKYNGALPQGMGTALLMLHRFDQESLKWEPIDAAATDVVSGFAYGYITRPGIYAVLGTTH